MPWDYLALLPVLLGALLQRVTGLGFALVAAPCLVLIFGPADGVLIVNGAAFLVSVVGIVLDHRRVEWRRVAFIVPAGVVGVAAGVLIALQLHRPVLEILVGGVLLAGLTTLLLARSRPALPDHPAAAVAAGTTSGVAAALAGLSGPPIAIYAGFTGWRGPGLAATMQVIFAATSATAITTKLLLGAAGLPTLHPAYWIAAAATLAIGLVLGSILAPRVNPVITWRLVIVIAVAGAVATIIHGVVTLAAE